MDTVKQTTTTPEIDLQGIDNVHVTVNELKYSPKEYGDEVNAGEEFKKLVDKYMLCEKRTLAEMLAMRDIDVSNADSGNDLLKKIIESPDTWRVHPDPVHPNTPYVPPIDYDDYCFSAPYNKCIRGGGAFKSCIGCPYYMGIWYSRSDGTGVNPNPYPSTTTSTTCTFTCDIAKRIKGEKKERLDD